MKQNLTKYAVVFLLGLAIMFFLKKCTKETVEVPVRVEIPVEVPVIVKEYDTVFKPKPIPYPIKEVDTALVEEYKKANDSLKKELFKQAVQKRQYKEVFDDSIQTITVDAEVTGKLNWIKASYETKPRAILVDTVIPVRVPVKNNYLVPYVETGVPTKLMNPNGVFKAGIDYSGKKKVVYGLSYDTQGRVWAKVGYRFNF